MIKIKGHYASLYLRFLTTFLFFTLFPVIIFGLLFYINFVRSSKQAFFEQYDTIFSNITHNSTDRLMMVENELLQLADNNAVRSFRKVRLPGENIEHLLALDDTLVSTKIKIPFLESIYVYDRESETLATSVSGNYEIGQFYDTQWLSGFTEGFTVVRYPLRWNIDDHLASREIYSTGIFMTPRKVITLAIANDYGKIIAVNINNESLYRLLTEQYQFENIEFMITDKTGHIYLSPPQRESPAPDLSSLDFHRDFNYFSDSRRIYLLRENNNHRYILTIPRGILTGNTRFFLNYVVLISAVLTILGTVLSFLMSNILYSPFNDLLGKIKKFAINEYKYDETKTRDELFLMRQIFGRLTEDKALLEDRVHLYEKTVRNRHFIDFLDGKFSYSQFRKSLDTVNFSITEPYYAFIILDSTRKTAGDDPSKYDRYKTIESVDTYLGKLGQGLFFDYSHDKYAAFCLAPTAEEAKAIIKKTYILASEVFQIAPFAAMSSIETDMEKMPDTFSNALQAFDMSRFYNLREQLADSREIVPREPTARPYQKGDEKSLIKIILQNDKEKLESFLSDLSARFTDPPYVKPSVARSQIEKLITAVRKEFPALENDGTLSFEIPEEWIDLASLIRFLRQLFWKIQSFVEDKGSNDNYYCTQVKTYLDGHHRENINLSVLSDHLNISYPYLSRIFKETTGLNILDYLNRIRIDKAKDMLREKNESLTAIARNVGYNNIQSFQRYFRKFEEMTPGEYRTKERLNGA